MRGATVGDTRQESRDAEEKWEAGGGKNGSLVESRLFTEERRQLER